MELTGIVKQVGKTQVITDKFSKRELILKTEYETKYPQYLVIQFTNKNVGKLDSVNVGEIITVGINIKGREYTDPSGTVKYFNTVEGWSIKKDGEAIKQETNKPEATFTDGEGDSLHF